MIRYDLLCDRDHAFDGWFSDSAAFDTQAKRGFVTCPHCGSIRVRKALMAPKVSGTRRQNEAPPAGEAQATTLARGAARDQEMRAVLRAMHAYVRQNADHVGDRFAEEARKIHYGESEQRSIFGRTSLDEARALHEEGIEVHALPDLPDDRN